MAKCKVVGVSLSSGEYQGFQFKNLVLHTLRKDEHTEGERSEQIKIKYKYLNNAFNLDKTAAEIDRLLPVNFSDLIGKEVEAFYDQFRNVTSVVVYGK